MKKGVFLLSVLLLVLVLPTVLAQDDQSDDYYTRESLKMKFEISNELTVIPLSSDYSIKDVSAYISFYPKDDFRQNIVSISTDPIADISDGTALFSWPSPSVDTLRYEISSEVIAKNTLKQVTGKVMFPIQEYGEEYEQYVEETETIDFHDPRIINIASELAGGEDDLYVVVHKFGEWVNKNIEYDLNTLTAEAAQKASWVLDQRSGVCDELTNLFIALCRSVNIPARFISGVSYTNSEEFTLGWSPHGWAEVYFPGYGWIPFDVTFGELGYIDATHISLKESSDANKSSSRYEWRGRNVNIETGSLNMDSEILSEGPIQEPLLDIRTEVVYDEVDLGSYNVVEVTLTNAKSYYVPVEVMLSRTDELKIFEDYNRYVLLRPKETKTIYWILKVDDNIDSAFTYTFTVNARTNRGAESTDQFMGSDRFTSYSLEEIRQYVSTREKEGQKTYSKDIEISCSADKIGYIVGETAQISCSLKNKGNVMLSSIKSCLGQDCQTNDLRIGETKELKFAYEITEEGDNKLIVTNDNSQVSKQAQLVLKAWGAPVLRITGLSYPESVDYNDDFKIEFKIEKGNEAPLNSVLVELDCYDFEQDWELTEMLEDRRFILTVESKTLSKEVSMCTVSVEYDDSQGSEYNINQLFNIKVQGIGFFDKIAIWLNNLVKIFS